MIEKMIDTLSAGVPRSEKEYLGEDGLLHCAVCHKKTETVVPDIFRGGTKKVRCICDCRAKELEANKERERQEEIYRNRRICFSESNMHTWTFDRDDRKNPKLSDAMKNYVENFSDFRKEGKGLLLYGNVGTGKSFLSACVANALIEKGYNVLMTNFATVINRIQATFDGKQEYINSLNKYTLLIIDDLGTESKSDYRQEIVYNVIDARYRSGLPMIITTNLTAEELKKPQDVGYSRIYDRILEKCFPVKVDGESRRRQNVKDTFFDTKEKLGL